MFPFLDVVKLLSVGTLSTTLLKSVFQYQVHSSTETTKDFGKAWFMTLMMFIGMSFAIFFETKNERLLQKQVKSSRLWFIFPTVFDLGATVTSSLALANSSVPASLYQLLGASLLVFTTINARLFLSRKQKVHQWIAVFLMIFALTCIGVASQLDTPTEESRDLLLGIILLLVAQEFWSLQFVVEEHLLQKLDATPTRVVFYEGVFGSSLMVSTFLPALQLLSGPDSGSQENSIETLQLLVLNPVLIVLIVLFIVVVLFYNIYGQKITQKLSSVHRTVIESLRSLGVWMVGLALYWVSRGKFGESWEEHSWLKGVGFVLLLVSSLVYNSAPGFKLKGLYYD
ncbi:hypothetical protein RCL1_003808 [Eukaryota sp. TZLM3-RCL]